MNRKNDFMVVILSFAAAGGVTLYEGLRFITQSQSSAICNSLFGMSMLAFAATQMLSFFASRINDTEHQSELMKTFTKLIAVYSLFAIVQGIITVNDLLHAYDVYILIQGMEAVILVCLTFVCIRGYTRFVRRKTDYTI